MIFDCVLADVMVQLSLIILTEEGVQICETQQRGSGIQVSLLMMAMLGESMAKRRYLDPDIPGISDVFIISNIAMFLFEVIDYDMMRLLSVTSNCLDPILFKVRPCSFLSYLIIRSNSSQQRCGE